jgi:hypothetical protein
MADKKQEDWMQARWRPAMGWMYMFVCMFDFVIAPILWSILQSLSHGSVQTQWQPLTLQGAGLFHMAMGAVLGIAAFGRTQEKLAGASQSGQAAGTTYVPPGAQNSVNVSNQSTPYVDPNDSTPYVPVGGDTTSTTIIQQDTSVRATPRRKIT